MLPPADTAARAACLREVGATVELEELAALLVHGACAGALQVCPPLTLVDAATGVMEALLGTTQAPGCVVVVKSFSTGHLSVTLRRRKDSSLGPQPLSGLDALHHTRSELRLLLSGLGRAHWGAKCPGQSITLAGVLALARVGPFSSWALKRTLEQRHGTRGGAMAVNAAAQAVREHMAKRPRAWAEKVEAGATAADDAMVAALSTRQWTRSPRGAKRERLCDTSLAFPRCCHGCGYSGCILHVAYGTQACNVAQAAMVGACTNL